jgi:hypothetical protein
MASVDEVLATMAEGDASTTNIDEVLVIDSNTRQISIPGSELILGVESDTHSERKYFQCPRHVGNGLDLTSCFIRVNFRNANGDIDSYLVDDVVATGDTITFSWELSRKVTQYMGQVKFLVCCNRPGGNGVAPKEWHTTQATGMVLVGLEPDSAAVETASEDVITALLVKVEAQSANVEAVGAREVAKVTAEGAAQVNAVKTASEATETAAVAEIEAKGVNVRASIPDDYTSLGNAVDGLVRSRAGAIVCEAAGSVVAVDDASDNYIQGLRIFGKSTQDGTPTPDAPVEIVSIENPVISVNDQTVKLTHTLPGVPVTSGGNYTDSDGQQWICDEVDLERGVYVQRVYAHEVDTINGLGVAANNRANTSVPYAAVSANSNTNALCSHFGFAADVRSDSADNVAFIVSNQTAYFRFGSSSATNTVELAKAWVEAQANNGTPLTVTYILATPIETPLSETEIAAYRAMHTNYPNTTVLNDSGAHMVVKYAADTKLYIDNKIKEALQ